MEIWKEFGRHLGNLIKAILFAYAPQAIVLGGGIVSAFPFFKNAMEQTMQSFPYKIISDNVSVVASHQRIPVYWVLPLFLSNNPYTV